MTRITLEEAHLIIKRWAESSALLLVATSEQPGDVVGVSQSLEQPMVASYLGLWGVIRNFR